MDGHVVGGFDVLILSVNGRFSALEVHTASVTVAVLKSPLRIVALSPSRTKPKFCPSVTFDTNGLSEEGVRSVFT